MNAEQKHRYCPQCGYDYHACDCYLEACEDGCEHGVGFDEICEDCEDEIDDEDAIL